MSLRSWSARAGGWGAILLGLASLSSPASGQAGVPVRAEGIAALVGSSTAGGPAALLRTDVSLRARLALAGRATRLPVGPLPEALLAATLEELIGEVLIVREADRLRTTQPTVEEVEREQARLELEAGGADRVAALLSQVGAEPSEVAVIARRRAYVQVFLRANLEGSTVVSDAQVQRVYESEEHPFGGRPLEEVQDLLRAWIAQGALMRDVRRWVEVLRSRSTVQVLAEWAHASATPE